MRTASLLLTLAALAGCDLVDPTLREGTWRPTHAMDANIAAQVTRPSTLVRGVDYVPVDSAAATAAVDRYRAGRVKKLQTTSTSQVGSTSTGGDDSGAAAAAGAGAAGQTQ